MRKFLTCALCFVPTLAGAITLYYDTTGECDGWWLETTQTGCPASNLRVTKFHPTTAESKVFGGIVIGGETVVESDGTLKSFNSLSENTKSAIRTATSLDVYKQEWNVDDTVTANFDTRGGKMSGATSRQMARGTALPTITTPRGDGASFDGWVNASGTKVTKVMDNATNGETYTANWKCGAGLSKNKNGVCVPSNVDTYRDDDGNERSLDDIDCDYLNGTGTGNENFCSRTVIVHLHDKPIDSSLTVTNGNEERTLWCNRVWCYEPYYAYTDGHNWEHVGDNAGALVETINMPHVDGYAFRGYFYRNAKTMNDLVVESTHKNRPQDVAAGQFYPKNASEQVKDMRIYNPTHGINIWYDPDDGTTDIQGLPYVTSGLLAGMREVDLYGGWARNCAPGEHTTCTLQKGIRIPGENGLYPGQVRYDAGCENGYHVANGSGTYNPVCEPDTGDINMSYMFIDQYSDVVSCATPITNTCTTGGNVSLLNKPDFNNACGTRYALRWLNVNATWYSPNKSVSCTSNVLGTGESVIITGRVCDVCNPDQIENGTCVNISRDTDIHFDPHGAGTYNGHLWGENGGNVNPTPACQVIKCDAGYEMWKNTKTGIRSCEIACSDGLAAYPDDNGDMQCLSPYQQCVETCQQYPSKCGNDPETYCQTSTFECPSGLTPPDGVTVGTPVNTGNQCQYEIGCSDSGAVLEHATSASNQIVCNGVDACTKQNVQNQLNQYSCFKCMSTTDFAYDGTLTIGAPTMAPNGVASSHSCSYDVLCKTGQYANQDPVGTVTCHSNDNSGQTPCRTLTATINDNNYYYYNITNLINQYVDSCSGTFACPTSFTVPGITITPASGNATATSSCSYTVSCPNETDILVLDTEREPDESGGTATVQCTGMSGNNSCSALSLSDKFSHYSCQSPEE